MATITTEAVDFVARSRGFAAVMATSITATVVLRARA
jgi:hypothetical protein